ncbi:MAG TPA: OmpA family protein [Methylomirabilota bacterium]|jgi:peptidoglycan-associated lipoprotein
MRPTATLTLITVLVAGIGCQAKPHLESAAGLSATPGVSSAPGAIESPDREAFAPAPPVPSPEQFVEKPQLRDIHFEYDAHDLRPGDTSTLDENAAWLKMNPGTLLLIEGHTDERGTNEYNLGLGDLRASAAMLYLAAQGVPTARMVAISYGKERPLCTEHTEACWAQNRRVHFLARPR